MTVDERVNAPAMVASGLVLGLVLFLVAAVYSSFTIIQPGNVGVVFNRFSGALKTVGQGVAWRVPWVTQVQSYPVALRTYTMVRRGEEGTVQGDDSIDLPTKEGQHIRQDISVTYNTSQERAADVFRSFRGAEIADIESTFSAAHDHHHGAERRRADVAHRPDLQPARAAAGADPRRLAGPDEQDGLRGRQGEPRGEPPP